MFFFVVLEDDLSQSLKNGYLLLEDEIDHVGSVVIIFEGILDGESLR